MHIPFPNLQLRFAQALVRAKSLYLQPNLMRSIKDMDIRELDNQLAEIVPMQAIAKLASIGLRGELVFPTPIVLSASPQTLGYYRLLYGFSRKEFYHKRTALARFARLEDKGDRRGVTDADCIVFCQEMAKAGVTLVDGLDEQIITPNGLNELCLLTFGAQLRGGANNATGKTGAYLVQEAIQSVVKSAGAIETDSGFTIVNSAGRTMSVTYAADPDICLEEHSSQQNRKILAVEIKGGRDYSNFHNRLGEAEKSHLKAKAAGFTEFWTVLNVESFDEKSARAASPTTQRFYLLSDIEKPGCDFKPRLSALLGLALEAVS